MVAIQGSQYLFPSYWVIVKAKLNLKNAQYILYTHNYRLNIDLHGVSSMVFFPYLLQSFSSLSNVLLSLPSAKQHTTENIFCDQTHGF